MTIVPIMWRDEPGDPGHDFDGVLRECKQFGVPEGGAVLVRCDAGAGPYFVLSCDERCFDNVEAFDAWAAQVRGIIVKGEA